MSLELSQKMSSIKPSPTLSLDAKAKAMKAEGIDVVNFGVGEPDFDTPENIKDAAINALRNGFTKYTPVGGIDDLKTAIVDKLKNDNNIEYGKNEIIVSCGAKHSLYNIAGALLDAGDEVIIPAPFWVSYPDQVLLNDAVPVIVKTVEKSSFMVTPELLKPLLSVRTKALILNSPSNPTGMAYDLKSLEAIAELSISHGFYIISDEIYEKIIYDGFRHVSIASLSNEVRQRTITVNGLSKSHSMTGWRIGYAAGPKDVIGAMTKIQSQSTSNPTSIAQKAAVEALTGPQDFIPKMLSEFDRRRQYILDRLNNINGVTCARPVGAFYVFPNVSGFYGKKFNDQPINSSFDLSAYFLNNAHVAAVPGGAFGDDSYIRLSYATSMESIQKGIDRIEDALLKLT
jgi:aspartate aminotransferase